MCLLASSCFDQSSQRGIPTCECHVGVQVDWLKGFLGGNDSILVKAMLWGGIQDVPSRAGPLEAALRSKCILLLAVTLKRRAVRYATLILIVIHI